MALPVAYIMFAESASLAIWGPIIALVSGVTVAVVTGVFSSSDHKADNKTANEEVLLTAYNQLVSILQAQINEVQKDNMDSTARAIQAEATAQRAILATQECEKRREEDRKEYQAQLQGVIDKQEADIQMLIQKHDRELAALSREIAVIRAQQQGDT